jgi:hypothetical protein
LNDNGFRATKTRSAFAPVVDAKPTPVEAPPVEAPKTANKRKAGAKRLRDLEPRQYVTVDEESEPIETPVQVSNYCICDFLWLTSILAHQI